MEPLIINFFDKIIRRHILVSLALCIKTSKTIVSLLLIRHYITFSYRIYNQLSNIQCGHIYQIYQAFFAEAVIDAELPLCTAMLTR